MQAELTFIIPSVSRSLAIRLYILALAFHVSDYRLSFWWWPGKLGPFLFPWVSTNQHVLLPHALTQPKLGVDQGPIHLVNAGLPAQLSALGWSVIFDGHLEFAPIEAENDPPIGILKNPRAVSTASEKVADVASSHAKKGELTISLGGDHSLVSGHVAS